MDEWSGLDWKGLAWFGLMWIGRVPWGGSLPVSLIVSAAMPRNRNFHYDPINPRSRIADELLQVLSEASVGRGTA